jgi:hypothetical protein
LGERVRTPIKMMSANTARVMLIALYDGPTSSISVNIYALLL